MKCLASTAEIIYPCKNIINVHVKMQWWQLNQGVQTKQKTKQKTKKGRKEKEKREEKMGKLP